MFLSTVCCVGFAVFVFGIRSSCAPAFPVSSCSFPLQPSAMPRISSSSWSQAQSEWTAAAAAWEGADVVTAKIDGVKRVTHTVHMRRMLSPALAAAGFRADVRTFEGCGLYEVCRLLNWRGLESSALVEPDAVVVLGFNDHWCWAEEDGQRPHCRHFFVVFHLSGSIWYSVRFPHSSFHLVSQQFCLSLIDRSPDRRFK